MTPVAARRTGHCANVAAVARGSRIRWRSSGRALPGRPRLAHPVNRGRVVAVVREDALVRGIAIVLFSDLVDSTAMLARLGDDEMARIVRTHLGDVTAAVMETGGRVVKFIGDGAMATFSSGLGALKAAATIQASVQRLDAAEGGIGLAARVGVSAGEPIADDGDLTGMAVVIAARLCGAAGSGHVLVQDVVRSLVASRDGMTFDPSEPLMLKGIPEPVLRRCAAVARARCAHDARGCGCRRGPHAATSPSSHPRVVRRRAPRRARQGTCRTASGDVICRRPPGAAAARRAGHRQDPPRRRGRRDGPRSRRARRTRPLSA